MAGNLLELQTNTEFVEISAAGLRESAPHDILNANVW